MKCKSLLAFSIASSFVLGSCALQADEVKWLESGSVIHATQDSRPAKSARDGTVKQQVTLSTGVVATLTGGVYAKAEDTSVVLAWALENNYLAFEDEFIPNAINIQTTPEQSLDVADAVAKLEGVTTAMPNYRTPRVLK